MSPCVICGAPAHELPTRHPPLRFLEVPPMASPYKSDKRLYLAEDNETVVEEGDERARYLLVGAGGEVPADEAERLGLKQQTKADAAVEDKQMAPAEDKSATRTRR